MSAQPLRIGSRASPLARAQTEALAARIAGPTTLVWIRSEADEDPSTALTRFGSTGVFTRAIHRALFEDRADCGVHSLKDLPVEDDPGTVLACVPEREDPRDALVSKDGTPFRRLPEGARVGTGSPRRAAQLLRARPDLAVVPVRGNVDTRLEKVRRGDLDAVVLAVAGLRRLGRAEEITEILDPELVLPAAGQGALGLTIRENDSRSEERLVSLRDVRAAAAVSAERAALHALGAGCHAPVGALAEVDAGRLRLKVRVCSTDGREMVEEAQEGALVEAVPLGRHVARALLDRGAAAWVNAV